MIELMIAVAVVGILVAIVYPSYQTQIRKSHRTEAQSALMNVAGRQQQFLLDTRSYAATLADLGVTVPPDVSRHYSISLAVANEANLPPTFTVTAQPLGDQTADSCATLTVNQAGIKTPASCW